MGAAMRNERLAARQKVADVYRIQLAASRTWLQQSWKKTVGELEKAATTNSASAAFTKCVPKRGSVRDDASGENRSRCASLRA
jgi:hypothetical protein